MTYQPTIPQRLDTLLHLHTQARQTSETAGLRVGQVQEQLRAGQAKLQQLQQYAAQYRAQLERLGVQGGDWAQMRDLRGFIERVEQAIAAQQQDLARLQAQLAEAVQALQAARQREKAFEVLIEQQHAQHKYTQKRHMLKELQEWALRRASQFLPSSQQRSEL